MKRTLAVLLLLATSAYSAETSLTGSHSCVAACDRIEDNGALRK